MALFEIITQVYSYRKPTFGTLISWTTYADGLLIEVTTVVGFTVCLHIFLHIFWEYQPILSPQTNNRVKLPKWSYWKVMLLFEKNTMSKNLRKRYYQRSKLPDFWFSCSLHTSLNISLFATKSIWKNLQSVLLRNCWIWSYSLDINDITSLKVFIKINKTLRSLLVEKKKDFSHGICK